MHPTPAGVVVGKVGTATVSPEELIESFKRNP
jgi:bifunctional ADP-heptose synthase (sugar kinase/adenylyltransferase)